MIVKEVKNNELYVYMNGSLLYKRWLKHGYGMVFGCEIFILPFISKSADSFKLIK